MKKFYLNKKKAATLLASTIVLSTLCGCDDANFKITTTSEYKILLLKLKMGFIFIQILQTHI